jgi:hypothetical protein
MKQVKSFPKVDNMDLSQSSLDHSALRLQDCHPCTWGLGLGALCTLSPVIPVYLENKCTWRACHCTWYTPGVHQIAQNE